MLAELNLEEVYSVDPVFNKNKINTLKRKNIEELLVIADQPSFQIGYWNGKKITEVVYKCTEMRALYEKGVRKIWGKYAGKIDEVKGLRHIKLKHVPLVDEEEYKKWDREIEEDFSPQEFRKVFFRFVSN